MASRFFSTFTRTTRHSHAAKGHNLNHLHGHKAPDKSIRYVNRPQYRHGLPMSFPNRSGIIPTPTRSRTRLPIFDSNNIIYAEARTITTSTKAPVHGMSSDGASKSMNQMDNEGWVDPEEMPTLSSFAQSVTEDNEHEEPSKYVSPATRRKYKAGMASAVPTDSEAAVSADKMDMTPQEMIQQTTRKARKQKMKSIEEDEKPTSLRDDSDVASLSTQGRVGNTVDDARSRQGQEAHEAQGKYEMSGKKNSSGKMNEDMSHPASYGSNPQKTKMKKKGDEWSA